MPGNHDLGDKLSEVAPAKAANDTTISIYKEAFGKNYYSFDHAGILFVVMNSSLVNGGTEEEKDSKIVAKFGTAKSCSYGVKPCGAEEIIGRSRR